ncbi:MAG: HAMP domain-containing sensor histidine kinase [Candidatus Riflebacteria bacterium]|nr:HAMP domain-containing sensor histidine kinase [Candidatus Riflebacteria bacterium]
MLTPANTGRRFFISLLLIMVSFVLLFIISYQSLRFQEQVLSSQNLSEKLNRLDKISSDFFARLVSSPLPGSAIPLPLARPVFPVLRVPESTSARQTFLKMAILPEQRLALLIEAELNAPSVEQSFWRYLLLNEYFNSASYFEMRRTASLIIDSNFDYLLDNGKTLKTEATIKVAVSFLRENNPEAARQWLNRLRIMPAPTVMPANTGIWFDTKLPQKLDSWLQMLFKCYQLSYSEQIAPGWQGDNDHDALILRHENGLYALQAGAIISALKQRFAENGFADVSRPTTQNISDSGHLLANSGGLRISLHSATSATIPGGFLLLLLLTLLGIAGLFIFALHEWQQLQKARLLDEEEQFFRQTAHDLKTPITIVSFLAETLALKRYKGEDQHNRYLNQLQTETQKAAELFDRLLLSVQLRKKAVSADLKSISASDILKKLLLRFRTRMSDWEIVEQYEGCDQIMADSDMFERAMINLIENVLRHAAEGRQLVIRTCPDKTAAGAEITVMIGDRGSAFPIAIKDAKLDLLNSSLPYCQERGGSGTGLFLVRQIIHTHGGQFYASCKDDGGIWMITTWRAVNDQDSGS